jgi:hypothetical protein
LREEKIKRKKEKSDVKKDEFTILSSKSPNFPFCPPKNRRRKMAAH